MSKYLAMYFDSPLQSWGVSSRLTGRRAGEAPSRSAVLGLICAALGYDRADRAGLEKVRRLSLTVVALRINTITLSDYHTVGGGWKGKGNPLAFPRKASKGLGKTATDTVVTKREYFQDCKFGAILRGGDGLIAEVGAALVDPVWGLWLGRKSCVPSTFVFQGVHESEDQAIEVLAQLASAKLGDLRFWRDSPPGNVESFSSFDEPLDFKTREFGLRRVSKT